MHLDGHDPVELKAGDLVLLPHGPTHANGPNDFPVNKTAAAAGIDSAAMSAAWRLTLTGGPIPVVLDRAALAAMPQHTAQLPIGCVQGLLVARV